MSDRNPDRLALLAWLASVAYIALMAALDAAGMGW